MNTLQRATTVLSLAALLTTFTARGADDPELAVLKGHKGAVIKVLFTLKGKQLLSLATDGKILAFDPTSHKQTATVFDRGARSMTLSPDGKTLAVSLSDFSVILCDVASLKPGKVLKGHKGPVLSQFSPDGTMLATADRNNYSVKVWDTTDGTELASIDAHSDIVHDLAFTSDNKRLITTSSDKTIKVWNPKTGKRQRSIQSGTNIMTLAIPKGDSLLVGSNGGVIKTWDLSTGKELAKLVTGITVLTSRPRCILMKDHKSVAVLDGWNDVFLVDLDTLNKQASPRHDKLNEFDLDAEQRLMAGAGSDSAVVIWDITDAKSDKVKLVATLKEHAKAVNTVAFSPDSKILASGSDDGTIRLWDVAKAIASDK